MSIEDNFRILKLLDIYGSLLTENQQTVLRDYFISNLTLSEIAEINNITRQAVNFNIKNAVALLDRYENSLNLCKKFNNAVNLLEDLRNAMQTQKDIEKINKIIDIIKD